MSKISQPDRSLPRRRRVPSSCISNIFENGSRQVGRLMVFWTLDNSCGFPRVAAVAGKKTFRRAVDRNRVKRRLKEAFRLNLPDFRGGYDVVLVARRGMLNAAFQKIESELVGLAIQAGLKDAAPATDK